MEPSEKSIKQRLEELEQLVMLSGREVLDSRLSEKQKRHMKHMMATLGIDERDAKIRVLCMGTPPDHFEELPAGGQYPKMLYHKSGKFCRVEDKEQHDAMTKEGWSDKPLKIHVDKLQRSTVARDEQINRLKKELDAELATRDAERTAAA